MIQTRILSRYVLLPFLIYNMSLPARGFPDYGAPAYQTASVGVDPTEVYNRLIGFASLDGRGRVLLLDTFQDGLAGWSAGFTGGGLTPVVTTLSPAFIAPASIILGPGVVANDTSGMNRLQFLGQTSRIGMEVSFRYIIGINEANFIFKIQYQYAGQNYRAVLKFVPSTANWRVEVAGIFTTVAIQPISNLYVQVKLVADFSTGMYVKLVIGENIFNIGTLALTNEAAVFQGAALYYVAAESVGAGTNPARLGYVLITRDEP